MEDGKMYKSSTADFELISSKKKGGQEPNNKEKKLSVCRMSVKRRRKYQGCYQEAQREEGLIMTAFTVATSSFYFCHYMCVFYFVSCPDQVLPIKSKGR